MRKIAVLNQKGGVGKTTTVTNLSSALADQGLKVLVIDLDPQAHLTIHLGQDGERPNAGAYRVLADGATVNDAMEHVRDNIWLLGAGIDLVGAETELATEVGREIILRNALMPVENDFDYLLIDCPPSLGVLTLNALAAVDEILIPVQPHFLALQGFSRLLQTITLVQSRINPKLKVSSILMCMFDSRTSLSTEVRDDINHFLTSSRDTGQPWSDANIIPVHIRRNIKLAEAPSHGQSIIEYEPACNGAQDYVAVANYIHTGSIDGTAKPQTDENTADKRPVDNDPLAANIEAVLAQTQSNTTTPLQPAPNNQLPATGPEA